MSKHANGVPECPACSEKLVLAHPDLASWFREKVKPKYPDAHISWSFRDKESQEQAFLDGKSKLHFPNSAHNKTPAEALDLFELDVNGIGRWAYGYFRDIAEMASIDKDPIFWGGHYTHLGDGDHYALVPKEAAQ